jgi:uncharacterized damage-inducible protein DinB
MTLPFPEPTEAAASLNEVYVRYLDYFRARLIAKCRQLPAAELHASRVPSGWTPIQLLIHMRYVEMRWLEWGFEGAQIEDVFGDQQGDGWHAPADATLDDVAAALEAQGLRTRAVVESHSMTDVATPGEPWEGEEPPELQRVLMHLVQEYAHHAGHLDIVVEQATK